MKEDASVFTIFMFTIYVYDVIDTLAILDVHQF